MDRVRVLVTGAAGPNFLRSAVSQLAKEHSVVGLDLSVVPALSESVDWMTGDVSDRALVSSAMQDVDVVVHGAVATGDGTYTSAEVPFRTNVLGTYNVFDCARLHAVRRIVLLSEAPVHLYAHAQGGGWQSSAGSDHLYDLTKHLQEEIAQDFAETFGLEVVVIRLGHVVDGDAGIDPDGNALGTTDYCRGGWVCCHDVASAIVESLSAQLPKFAVLNAVGSTVGRVRFDIDMTERALGVRFRNFDRYDRDSHLSTTDDPPTAGSTPHEAASCG